MRNPWIILFLVLSCSFAQAEYKYPFENPKLPEQQRINNLLSLMTLQEKIDLLGRSMNIPRLGVYGCGRVGSIPGSCGQFEGLHGLALGGPNGWGGRSPGLPAVGGGGTIATTQFSQSTGLGETWDPALIEQVAEEEAREARYIYQTYDRGGLIVRAPNADLARDPRWGRLEESYGEDPFLVGTMSAAFVRGLQGNDPHYLLTAALVKHFLANSNEDGRTRSSSNFGPRLLHEYYAMPFEMAIKEGGANSMMASYNAVNGIPMATSPLLRQLLMKRWGLNGIIETDRAAMTLMVKGHHYYPNLASAAAGAIKAGINQFLDHYQGPVKSALQHKMINIAQIDQNLQGVLRVMIHLGFLNPPNLDPYTKINGQQMPPPWTLKSSQDLDLRATEESIVLLKNQSHLLPLDSAKLHSIAVIGPMANVVYSDGYGGTAPFLITPTQGLKAALGVNVQVNYSQNTHQALKYARQSNTAIVFVGNPAFCKRNKPGMVCPNPTEGQEGIDRKEITLPLNQQKLIQKVFAANPRTIVVLVSSFPFAIDWTEQHVPAILNIAQSSEVEGTALANILLGKYDPAGRLTITWPASIHQLPAMMDYNIRDGRTYMYFKGKPLYPFGYGLSYTNFNYSDMQLSKTKLFAGSKINIRAKITNSGDISGDEVVQLYVQHLEANISWPRLELKGFKRIAIPAHQSRWVEIPLSADALRYWNNNKNKWTLERDKVKIILGSSSSDPRISQIIQVIP